MSLVVKYNENKPVPEDIYLAKLTNLDSTSSDKYGAGIRWSFEIIDGPEAGTTVTALSSTKVSPTSKIFSWMSAFGEHLTPGQDVDLESYIGRKVKIRVKNKTNTKTVEGNTVTTTFSNVDALSAYVPPTGDDVQPETVTPATTPAAQPEVKASDNDDSSGDYDF